MDINKKIEEIRQQPEHIRLRYIWGLVAISMLFIVTIWVFSLKESAKKLHSEDTSNLPDISQSLEEIGKIKDSTPSINDIMENDQNLTNTGKEFLENQKEDALQSSTVNN